MTDEDILKYFENKKCIFWNNLPEEIINYLQNRYNDNNSNCIKESYLRILNHIDIIPKCPICNKPVKFYGHSIKNFYKLTCGNPKCSNKLAKIHRDEYNLKHYGVKETWQRKDCKQHCRETWKQKYGVENPYNIKEIQEKCVKNAISKKANEKRTKTLLEKYGVDNIRKSEYCKKKIKQTLKEKYGCENYRNITKYEETCLKKYGKKTYQATDEFKKKISLKIQSKECQDKRKNTSLKRYGIINYNNKEKHYLTQKQNNTFNTSIPEDKSYILLKEKYPDILRHYKSKLYPFNCDFYIPSLDLYIECQYGQFHHQRPYIGNEKDLKDVEILKERANRICEQNNVKKSRYDAELDTWTIRDVKKRNVAKQNNLNYIEFWNIDELKNWLNKS